MQCVEKLKRKKLKKERKHGGRYLCSGGKKCLRVDGNDGIQHDMSQSSRIQLRNVTLQPCYLYL